VIPVEQRAPSTIPRMLAHRTLSAGNVTFGRILEDVWPLAAQLAGVQWWRCRGNAVVH